MRDGQGVSDGATHGTDANRCSVAVGNDHIVKLLGLDDLIVRFDRETLAPSHQRALGRIGRCHHKRTADFLKRKPSRGELRRIDLAPDGWSVLPAQRNLRNALHPRNLLRQIAVRIFINERN